MEFEWDPRKAAANRRKHGVSFVEATTVFDDEQSITCPDPRFVGENRYVTLGSSERGRLLLVVYTERGERTRIISARRARARDTAMKKVNKDRPRATNPGRKPDMLPEYDFAGGTRGQHSGRYPGHAAALVQQAQEAADLSPRLRRLWLDDLRAAFAGDPRQAAILAAVELLWAAKAQQETVRLALAHAFGESTPARRGRGRRAV